MFAPFFFQGAGEPPTPRDIIGRSLRFRGSQYLRNTLPNNNQSSSWTWSCWVKLANTGDTSSNSQYIVAHADSAQYYTYLYRQSGNAIASYAPLSILTTNTGYTTTPNYPVGKQRRDPSAWYHVVWVHDTDANTLKTFVNGELNSDDTATNTSFNKGRITIGARDFDLAASTFLEGYMADVYFIDGSALPPTTFGKYDDNGVWVPINNPALRAPTGVYSNFLYGTDNTVYGQDDHEKLFLNNYPPINGFNGDTGNGVNFGTGAIDGNWGYWTPPSGFTNVTTLRLNIRNTGAVRINGVDQGLSNTSGGVNEWVTVTSPPETINQIAWQGLSGFTPQSNAIEVNGQILIDSTLYQTGLSTSPAGSYVTTGRVSNTLIAPEQAFNGNLADQCQAPGAGAWIYWETNLNCSTVQLYVNNDPDQLPDQVYINGQQVAVPSSTLVGSNYVTSFEVPDGKLTEFAFDNTGIGPNTSIFGMSIDNGPILIDGVSAGYGDNGFHLTFADPNDIGKDYSGNGNDFTAIGFDTQLPGIWSNMIDAPNGMHSGSDTTYMFQDNIYSSAFTAGTVTFTPTNPIAVRNKVSLWVESSTGPNITASINGGTAVPLTTSQYNDIPFTGDLRDIVWVGTATPMNLTRVAIDDVQLVDNTGTDYDLMQDSPTQNYATLNPLPSTASTNITNANLTWSASSNAQASQTIALPTSGRYYFEYELTGNNAVVGAVTSPEAPRLTVNDSGALFLQNYSSGTAATATVAPNADINGSATVIPFGETQSWAYDADAGTIKVRSNNVLQYTIENFGITGPFYVQVDRDTTTATEVSFNFGQQPFQYNPPAGFEALQTQNLPTATIPDGRDYFQAITAPGPGTYSSQITNVSTTVGPDYLAGATYSGTTAANAALALDDSTTTGMAINYLATQGKVTLGTPILTNDTLRIRYLGNPGGSANNSPMRAYVNNVSYGTGYNAQWVSITGVTQINSFAAQGSGQPNQSWTSAIFYAIEVDGQIVVNAATTTTLTFENSLNFEELSVGDSVVSFPSGATGIIISIDASTNTIDLSNVTGTWEEGQQLYSATSGGSGILGLGKATFPKGLYWIKDIQNANQWQFVSSATGDQALQCPAHGALAPYVAPIGNSVAYCWNSVNDPVTYTNGTLPSQVSAEPKSGFSIVKYNGIGQTATIGHGLDAAPDFIIVKGTNDSENFFVYTSATTATDYLVLDNDGAAIANTAAWNDTEPTNQVFTVGTLAGVNGSANPFVAYCWTSIPGYSAFGSYTGNASADGPFVYLGFKPAFVLIKATISSYRWVITDSTTNPNNPASNHLFPNSTDPETSEQDIDFLSNGFKLRSSGTDTNATGNTYIYAAFAENPFGADNTSPATAY